MSKKEVKLKGVMGRDQVVAYLEDLLAGLKSGKICVQQGEEFVTLCPEQLINVEVQASVKKGKEKFEMELVWRKEEAPVEMSGTRISASEPEAPEDAAQELPAVSGPAVKVQASKTTESAAEAPKIGEETAEAGGVKWGEKGK